MSLNAGSGVSGKAVAALARAAAADGSAPAAAAAATSAVASPGAEPKWRWTRVPTALFTVKPSDSGVPPCPAPPRTRKLQPHLSSSNEDAGSTTPLRDLKFTV